MMGANLLEARSIAKHFGGVKALSDVSLAIRQGEIYGLIGPNGAGKTTFFNVLTGLYHPNGGELLFDGYKMRASAPHLAAQSGIARTFQNIRLFGNMTALENVMVGRHVRTQAGVVGAVLRDPQTRREEAGIHRRAEELLHYVNIADRADDLARHLSYGDQRRLEIARALAIQPKVILLDEPAAGLNPSEVREFIDLVLQLHERFGFTVIFIEHRMEVVMNLSHKLYVLNFGKLLASGEPADVRTNRDVIEAYIGEEE